MEVPRFPNDLKFLWAGEMAQWVRHLLVKLSSIAGTHIVEEQNQLPLIVF